MARRIRSIKPEILEDIKTASLSHEAFRLFVSMICLADDYGATRADARFLSAQVFWGAPVKLSGVTAAMDELSAANLVLFYEVRGQRYAQLIGWNKHQRVDHPGKPQVPRPDDDQAWRIPPHPTRVYFVQAETSKAIKIGVSWNPKRRLAELQNGHHEALSLIGELDGDSKLERELHRRFASSRMSGEWFACTDELLETIKELDRAKDSPMTLASITEDSRETLATDLGSGIWDLDQDLDLDGKPDSDESVKPATAPTKPKRKLPRHTLPDGWSPTDAHCARARESGLDVNREAERFRNHAAQDDRKCVNWNAAFSNWLLKAEEYIAGRGAKPGSKPGGLSAQDMLALSDDLERRGM